MVKARFICLFLFFFYSLSLRFFWVFRVLKSRIFFLCFRTIFFCTQTTVFFLNENFRARTNLKSQMFTSSPQIFTLLRMNIHFLTNKYSLSALLSAGLFLIFTFYAFFTRPLRTLFFHTA